MNISEICAKFSKNPNKIKRYSITWGHIWPFSISVLIRYTISESLVETQQFRHEWASKIYENTQKRMFHNLFHIKVYVLTRYTFCIVWWQYVLPNANADHFCDIVFQTYIGQCIAQKMRFFWVSSNLIDDL